MLGRVQCKNSTGLGDSTAGLCASLLRHWTSVVDLGSFGIHRNATINSAFVPPRSLLTGIFEPIYIRIFVDATEI